MKIFGLRLRQLRKSHNLTQQNVADALHIDRPAVAYYESGKAEPSLEALARLVKLFGISYDTLLSNKVREPGRKAPSLPITPHN